MLQKMEQLWFLKSILALLKLIELTGIFYPSHGWLHVGLWRREGKGQEVSWSCNPAKSKRGEGDVLLFYWLVISFKESTRHCHSSTNNDLLLPFISTSTNYFVGPTETSLVHMIFTWRGQLEFLKAAIYSKLLFTLLRNTFTFFYYMNWKENHIWDFILLNKELCTSLKTLLEGVEKQSNRLTFEKF